MCCGTLYHNNGQSLFARDTHGFSSKGTSEGKREFVKWGSVQREKTLRWVLFCENKKAELLNFLEILEELDKNEKTDRQTIEQDVLADVALCSMNMERDAIQEMYEAGKISYGTSVSMKNDITLLELQME